MTQRGGGHPGAVSPLQGVSVPVSPSPGELRGVCPHRPHLGGQSPGASGVPWGHPGQVGTWGPWGACGTWGHVPQHGDTGDGHGDASDTGTLVCVWGHALHIPSLSPCWLCNVLVPIPALCTSSRVPHPCNVPKHVAECVPTPVMSPGLSSCLSCPQPCPPSCDIPNCLPIPVTSPSVSLCMSPSL